MTNSDEKMSGGRGEKEDRKRERDTIHLQLLHHLSPKVVDTPF